MTLDSWMVLLGLALPLLGLARVLWLLRRERQARRNRLKDAEARFWRDMKRGDWSNYP